MISTELLKGSLRTIVLKLLKEEGPMHGYAITRRVEELTDGRIKLTYGALYPMLHKLESENVLVTTSENLQQPDTDQLQSDSRGALPGGRKG